MGFTKTNSLQTTNLPIAGSFISQHPTILLTAPAGSDGSCEVGHFCMFNDDGILTKADGNKYIGVTPNGDVSNLDYCDNNKIDTFITIGVIYVALKDGISPKFGDYIKINTDGTADVGEKADGVGLFLGLYGTDYIKSDGTILKTMQIQLGGI